MRRLNYSYARKFVLPRGFVLLTDLLLSAVGFIAAYLLRFNFDTGQIPFENLFIQLAAIVLPAYLTAFLANGTYKGIIRHSSIEDASRLAMAVSEAVAVVFLFSILARTGRLAEKWFLPYSIVLIHAAVTSVLLLWSKLIVRSIYHLYIASCEHCGHVLIFGAGRMGKATLGVLENAKSSGPDVVGFIEDDKLLIGKRISGIPIYSEKYAFEKLLKRVDVRELILAVDREKISPERRKALFDRCLESGVTIREVPPIRDWMNGKLHSKQIRDIRIEDLLGRDPIMLDQEKVAAGLKDTVVLVSGAAGSIGSEIVRQLLKFGSRLVVLLDQAESALYDLQNELLRNYPADRFAVVVGSITDPCRMRAVFRKFKPGYVFNAAAYKHVPLMEESPSEAIRVNVGGTRVLATLAVEFGVRKFVMISTDKAVNPGNVMGASKRICELYVQALAQANLTTTQFITTRFGNVLGSNGSVVPLFRKQIEAGGPVTVTDPDILRYFMTIPEACQLVLEAGFMGHGGEIFVFDMGQPVKIYDLAVKMISLAGLKPGEDIQIRFTGLRPGEKLYEELLTDKENVIPTYHPKIMLSKVKALNSSALRLSIDSLIRAVQAETDEELVRRMKHLVPEFVSLNSVYSCYDKPPVKKRRKQSARRKDLQPLLNQV